MSGSHDRSSAQAEPTSGAAPFRPIETTALRSFLRAHAGEITAATRRIWLPIMLLMAVPYSCAVSDFMCMDNNPMTVANVSGETVAVTPYFQGRDGKPMSLIVHGLHRRAITLRHGESVELMVETGDFRFPGMLLSFEDSGEKLLLPGKEAEKTHPEIRVVAPDRYQPAPTNLASDLGFWRTYRAALLGFIGFVLTPSLVPALFSMLRAYTKARERELDVIRAQGVNQLDRR